MKFINRDVVLAMAVFALLVVYPIPNVIALRNGLLIVAFAAALPLVRQTLSLIREDPWAMRALYLLAALYIWLVFVAIVMDPTPFNSLREFLGQWVTALASFMIGLVLAVRWLEIDKRKQYTVILLVFAAGMFHVVGQDLGSLWKGIKTQQFPFRYYPMTDHPANVGYVVTLLLPLLGADLLKRAHGQGGLLPWQPWVTYCSALMSCLALLTAGSRNGQFVFLVMAAVIGATLWWHAHGQISRTSRVLKIVALLTIVSAFAGAAYKLDGRWNRVAESIRLGWDTDSHKGWVYVDGRDIPKLADDKPVEESAYLRTAFLKEGLRALRAHLLGTEINRNAFKNLVTAQYGTAGMCCAHNALVDLGISAGVPAMILWCAFLYVLYRIGRQTLRDRRDIIGYALILLVIGFGVRMILDSTLRDHIILQFMLCAGMLMGVCLAPLQMAAERKVDQ